MSETYPKRTFAKRFSQDIFPSSVGIGDKDTTLFWHKQENMYENVFFVYWIAVQPQWKEKSAENRRVQNKERMGDKLIPPTSARETKKTLDS